jgi:hypothetical protein
MLDVREIANSAAAGQTNPFLCKLSDDCFYYVKGRSLNCDGLVKEYVSAILGRKLGLPIPNFSLVRLPNLAHYPADQEGPGSLGFGVVFASQRVPDLADLGYGQIASIPQPLRRDVAVFDYWIGNGDRSLTAAGGNPNLFWDVAQSRLHVFDHNLAFADDYSLRDTLAYHPFREDLEGVLADTHAIDGYCVQFAQILTDWHNIENRIPEDWLYKDERRTIDANIDFAGMFAWLNRLCHADNWGG